MRPLFHLLSLSVLIFLSTLVFAASPASAQMSLISGSEKGEAPNGMETIVKEAREKGSTVIVIQPKGEATDTSDAMASMRAERFLKARSKTAEILKSGSTLWPAMMSTFNSASPDGTLFWIFRAFATAILGVLLATYSTSKIFRWADRQFEWMKPNEPKTTADKVQYLLVRTVLAVVLVFIAVTTCFVVAVILDSGHEPTRRMIFELIMANAAYRFLRHGVSWNLFAGAMPKHRLVNLTDEQAVTVHRDFHLSVLLGVIFIAFARFVSFTGEDQNKAGMENVLTANHILFLQLTSALLVTLLVIFITLKNWRAWQQLATPSSTDAAFYKLRATLAKLLPFVGLVYAFMSMTSFIFRLANGFPAPGIAIAAPFLVFYCAVLVYGIVLLIIQSYYNRREKRFYELAAIELEKHEENVTVKDDESGEEVIVSKLPPPVFEFQPAFREFFENAALAIIITFAIGELARVLGTDVARDGHPLTALLDIMLAAILCWLAYRAVSIFIDRRLEQEGGAPEEEEMGGDGGGAGASRVATLLPIARYVMIITLFSAAGMIILSRMGFDIGPLFAGAGVVGIAVGFGAQTLIRDIFSGAFFLMDDAFRRGEYVEIEGIKGTVEKISIRSFQLRHHLGALHTIPFGEIKQLTNYSRDWVLMKLPLRVTYDTDVEKVRKLVKKLGISLLDHPQVGHTFMQPLKSQGVYKMEDSAMIIRVKFMTKPGEQFVTRKVVYESIQDLFAREGIHFAHKEVTVRLADGNVDDLSEAEKQAVSSAARSVIDAEEEEALKAAGGAKESGR